MKTTCTFVTLLAGAALEIGLGALLARAVGCALPAASDADAGGVMAPATMAAVETMAAMAPAGSSVFQRVSTLKGRR